LGLCKNHQAGSYEYSDSDAVRHAHAECHANAIGYTDTDYYQYSYPDSDCYEHTHSDTHKYTHGDSDEHTDDVSYVDTFGYAYGCQPASHAASDGLPRSRSDHGMGTYCMATLTVPGPMR